MKMPEMLRNRKRQEDLFNLDKSEQIHTTNELIEKSKLSQSYYFMLLFSAVIVVSGILTDNMLIVIAGVLVAPLLNPIMALSLGLVMLNKRLVIRSTLVLTLSSLVVIVVSILIPSLYSPFVLNYNIPEALEFTPLYFLVSVFAGMAAAFSWTKEKKMAGALPGAAIAVTLVPPLSQIGIDIAMYNTTQVVYHVLLYSFNLITIVGGSAIVFMFSGFFKKKEVKKEIEKELDKEVTVHELSKRGIFFIDPLSN